MWKPIFLCKRTAGAAAISSPVSDELSSPGESKQTAKSSAIAVAATPPFAATRPVVDSLGTSDATVPSNLNMSGASRPHRSTASSPVGHVRGKRHDLNLGEKRPTTGRDEPSLRARSAQAAQSDPAPSLCAGEFPLEMPTDAGAVANPLVFLSRETIVQSGYRVSVRDAYQAYLAWAREHDLPAASLVRFGHAATALGFSRRKSRDWFYSDRNLRCLENA